MAASATKEGSSEDRANSEKQSGRFGPGTAGVFQIPGTATCEKAVLKAIASSCRLIDTAAYGNETAVGAAIRKCGLPQEELFITTQLWGAGCQL